MAISLKEIQNDPEFQSLPFENRKKVLNGWYSENVASDSEYQSLPPAEQSRIQQNFQKESAVTPGNSGTWGDPSTVSVLKKSIQDVPYSAAQGVGGLGRMLGEAVGSEKIADWGRDVYQGAGIEMQKDMPEIRSGVKRAMYGGVQSLAQNLPGMAASIATGNPIPALASIGALAGGQSYGESREKGVTPGKAALGAIGEGGLEVATEYIPMGYLLKPGLSFAKRTLFSTLSELVGENINTVGQKAVQWWTRNPDKTVGEFVGEMYPGAKQTSLQVLMTSPIMALGAQGAHRALSQTPQIPQSQGKDLLDNLIRQKIEVDLPKVETPLVPQQEVAVTPPQTRRMPGGIRRPKDLLAPQGEPVIEQQAPANVPQPKVITPPEEQPTIKQSLTVGTPKEPWQTDEENIIESSKSVATEKEPLKTVGYRYGDAPESGYSFNTRENKQEKGVSMASVAGIPESRSFATMAAKKRGIKYYEGDVIGYGSDGEPIMINIVPITETNYHKKALSKQTKYAALQLQAKKYLSQKTLENIWSDPFPYTGINPYTNEVENSKIEFDKQLKALKEYTDIVPREKPDVPSVQTARGAVSPPAIQIGTKVKLGKSPQVWTVTKAHESTQKEIALGEQYFDVKNNKTGEVVQNVQIVDIKPLKSKMGKVEASSVQEELLRESITEERHAGIPIPSLIKSIAKLPGIERVVGFFNPLKGLSEEASIEYQNIRNKEKGREARIQRFVMNQFDRLSEMPTDVREQMFHALTSRESMTKLPKKYWRKVESLRNLHKYIGKMAVKRGILSKETYDSNKGEWVKHIYEKYIDEKKESLSKQQSTMTLQLDWKNRKLPDTSFGVDEQRARGLKEDVATAVPVGMTEVLTDLSRSDMFDEILKNPELTWQPSVVSVDNGQGGLDTWTIGTLHKHIESQEQAVLRNPDNMAMKNELSRLKDIMNQAQKESGNAPKGYTQLPDSMAYGKLAGAFVKDAVARDIMPALSMFGKGTSESAFYNAVNKIMTKGIATFKASKVAFNLPSWFRNGGADLIMFNMKGTPLYEIPYWMEKSALGMMKGTPEYTQAFRKGLFRTKYSDVEINNFLGISKKLLGQDYSIITEVLSGASNLYGKIDDWFKFAIYLEERSNGKDVDSAVRQANKWGMDYSLVHPFIKITRQTVMPFSSFNYKFVPLFAETALERPWIMAKYMAIPLIMMEAVKHLYNMDDDDVDKLAKSLPSYVRKEKTIIPLITKSPEGDFQWVDGGYFLPWNTEIQLYKAIKDKDIGGSLKAIGVGNPFLDIYAIAKSGHRGDPPRNPYNGVEIYNRLDTKKTKLFKLLEYNYNLFAPGMFTRYGAAGKVSEIGKKDKYGRTVTPIQAMLRFIGINIIAPTKEQGRLEKVAKVKELQSSLYKGIRDSRGDKEYQRKLRERFKKERHAVLAGED